MGCGFNDCRRFVVRCRDGPVCPPVVLNECLTTGQHRPFAVGEGFKPSPTFEGFSTAMRSRGIVQHGS